MAASARVDPFSPSDAVARLEWYVAYRWFVAAVLIAGLIVARASVGPLFDSRLLLVTLAAYLALNVISAERVARWRRTPAAAPDPARLRRWLGAQLALGVLAGSTAVQATGGFESPARALLVLVVIAAAIVLPGTRAAWAVAWAVSILHLGLGLGELRGLLPHVHLPWFGPDAHQPSHVALSAMGLGLVSLMAAWVTTSLVRRLAAAQAQGQRQAAQVELRNTALTARMTSERALAEIQRKIGEGLDPATSFAQFAGPLGRLTCAGAIALVLPQRSTSLHAWAWRYDRAEAPPTAIELPDSAFLARVDGDEPVPCDLVGLPDGALRQALTLGPRQELAAVPLSYGGVRQGVLLVAWYQQPGLDEEQRHVLGIVARHIAATVASARLFSIVATGKRQWERTFDAMPELIYVIDREGMLVRVNRTMATRLDCSPRDLVGRHVDDALAGCHPTFRDAQDVDSTVSVEATCPRFGGTYEVTTLRLLGEDGERMGIVRIARDLTEQKRLSQQVAQADKMAAIGLIAAGVAHEVNNPVAYIMSNMTSMAAAVDELAGRFPEPMPEDLRVLCDDMREMAKESYDGGIRIRDIVRGLTTFSRLDGGPEVEPLDAVDLVERVLRLTQHEIRHRAEVVRRFDPVPAIRGNQGKLSQVILNLVVNAVQAMEEVGDRARILTVGARREGGEVHITVADTGTGMSPAVLERIFDPFFTTKDVGKGTGLGLSVAQQIVRQHGGDILVESRLGGGTTFTVSLPAAEAKVVRLGQHTPEPEPVGSRGRILVVDDEPILLKAYRRLLGRHHEVFTVGSGREALEMLSRDTDFDTILCDMMMPLISGKELYEIVCARWPELRDAFVFLTGGVSDPEIAKFLTQVDNPVLEKPITDETLLGAMRKRIEAAAAAGGAERRRRRGGAAVEAPAHTPLPLVAGSSH